MSNTEKVKFLEYQKPALETGDYRVKFDQLVETGKGGNTFQAEEVNFSVQGERFSLDPSEVHVMYPPPGSLGRHSDCFPHISIKRSTFPWERSAYGDEDFEPWLALLLFDEKEFAKGEVKKSNLTLAQLKKSPSSMFPGITLESGQDASDIITVIDVKKGLLEELLPSGEELKLLAHVRQRVNGDDDNPESELAVIMANRLPKEGSGSIVHLVSVEERYKKNGSFNYSTNRKSDYIRLVSLKNWSFACLSDEGKNFEELVEDISTDVVRIRKSDDKSVAEPYLAKGYVAIPHDLRQCDRTYSWFHGPLSPMQVTSSFNKDTDLPEFSDELIHYHPNIGMFDSSYAAAYELGRILAISDDTFSKTLFQWKYQLNEQIALELQSTENARLVADKIETDTTENDELEIKIRHWFRELAMLKQVPFNYLIPDEEILPQESMRFFKLDNHWMECLLLGAFSIGGTIRRSANHPVISLFHELTGGLLKQARSGFMVRSQLVSDYPDLLVDAYGKKANNRQSIVRNAAIQNSKLEVVRVERISSEVLFYLVEGEVSMAELYLKPEGLRFGLDEEEAEDGCGMKYEKDLDTVKEPISLGQILSKRRVIHIKKLAELIRKALGKPRINSALFGVHMIEGSNKGRFVKQ